MRGAEARFSNLAPLTTQVKNLRYALFMGLFPVSCLRSLTTIHYPLSTIHYPLSTDH